jgi:glycosyltransferase involved in cell wall biosynthesis
VSDTPHAHILFCAFAEVPGTSAAGTRMAQWLRTFGGKEVDALSIKGTSAAHIQRLGGARMMRVPNTTGKPFLERLSTYQRALQRQLAGDSYDLVWAADVFSAGIVAPLLKGQAPLIVEVDSIPSSRVKSYLGDEPVDVQKKWREQERAALRAASRVILPSRHAAKLLTERVDPRVLLVVPRCVDRTTFTPPSVEISLDEQLVLIFGGREGGGKLRPVVNLAHALAQKVAPTVRIGILGMPNPVDADLRAALAKKGVADRVELVDADNPLALTGALSQADVVVVPSSAEEDLEPFAVPHRALEAMACARAVVLTGNDASFRDAVTPSEHLLVVPPRDPARAVEAVTALLADTARRDTLRRAGLRHVERTADLAARSAELADAIYDATKVRPRLHEPRDSDPDTSSVMIPEPPKMKPAVPLETESGPFASARAAPLAVPSSSPPVTPAASMPAPMATVKMDIQNLGLEVGAVEAHGLWEGDTFLDGGPAPAIETNPDAARVRAAMLLSSDAQSKAERSFERSAERSVDRSVEAAAETLESSGLSVEAIEEAERKLDAQRSVEEPRVDDASIPTAPPVQSQPPSVPTSVLVQAALEEIRSPNDPWAPDTIADGSPIVEPHRPDGTSAPPRTGTSKKSLLVDASRLLDDAPEIDPDLVVELPPAATVAVRKPQIDLTTEDAGHSLSSDEG